MKTKQTLMGICRNTTWILMLIFMIGTASAAFSSPYLENNTVTLTEDGFYDYILVFQNPQAEDTTMDVTIIQGSEWVNLTTMSVLVPAQNYDTASSFRVQAPKDAEGKYTVSFNEPQTIEYSTTSGDGGAEGMVPVSSQIKKSFKVILVSNQENPASTSTPLSTQTIITIISILGILAIVGYIIYKEKMKTKQVQPINESPQQ